MAIDDVLMESVREGGAPTLRLYAWNPPTVSLGRNQPARGLYPLDELSKAGVECVRRQTGGRAVLHHLELTYSAILPDRVFGSARGAYVGINRILVGAIGSIGVEALVHEAVGSAPVLSARPCFAEPAHGEVISAGRKLIGSAQLRRDGVLLQHGSIPLARSPLLDSLPPRLAASLDGTPAYLHTVQPSTVMDSALQKAIAATWSTEVGDLREAQLTDAEEQRVHELATFYEDDGWTWRR